MSGSHVGIAEGGVALQLLDHGLVFLAGLDAGDADGGDLNAAQVAPLAGELLVEGLGQLGGVAGQSGVADTHLGDAGKGRLQSGQQLALHLAVQLLLGVIRRHVAADIGVEQQGVGEHIAVLTEAADGDVDIQTDVIVHHAEGNGRRRAVLVAGDLLGIEIVHALILGGLAAEGEALADLLEDVQDPLAQLTGEDGGLGGGVVDILARLGADVHDLALLHDQHALTVGHGDDGAAGDDVVAAPGVGGAAGIALSALDSENVVRQGFTVEILLPLIGENAAGGTQCCKNKTHSCFSFPCIRKNITEFR